MNNIPHLSPGDTQDMRFGALEVCKKLSAGTLFGHAVQIWNLSVRIWLNGDDFYTNEPLLEELAGLASVSDDWEEYKEDVGNLLSSYESYKNDTSPLGQTCLRMLSRAGLESISIIRNIASVESASP